MPIEFKQIPPDILDLSTGVRISFSEPSDDERQIADLKGKGHSEDEIHAAIDRSPHENKDALKKSVGRIYERSPQHFGGITIIPPFKTKPGSVRKQEPKTYNQEK